MGAGEEVSSSSSGNQNGSHSDITNVILNVYDLTPINNYSYWVGFGIFHSGIEGLFSCLDLFFLQWILFYFIFGCVLRCGYRLF